MSAATSVLKRVALVTGGNKGIGYEIVKQLGSAQPDLTILLGSRDVTRGAEAVKQLALPNVSTIAIDVASSESIDHAVKEVTERYGGLDLLCNNAGIYLRARDTGGEPDVVDATLQTNYYGTVEICQKFAPLMRKNGRIVNVASQLGPAALDAMSDANRKKFTEQTTIEGLTALVKEFRAKFVGGKARASGWGTSAYGFSKAAVIVATKILAEQAKNGVTVHSGCPGWCQTDMTKGVPAPLTAQHGGEMITYILTMPSPQKVNGEFFQNKAVSKWL